MAISEKKMQIVIDNYFKSECNVDTSIRDAFEKGFRIGIQKTENRPKGEWIFNPKDAIELIFTKPKCSECGFESSDGGNFCPNCGAKMKGGDTE